MNIEEEHIEHGQITYLIRSRGRVTRLVLRHLGNGKLRLHWISANCRAKKNADVALRLAWGTRRSGMRACPGRADLSIDDLRCGGSLSLEDFPAGVRGALNGGLSNHVLPYVLARCNRPAPYWAAEPELSYRETDDDPVEHWRSPGAVEAPDGSGSYTILPAPSHE